MVTHSPSVSLSLSLTLDESDLRTRRMIFQQIRDQRPFTSAHQLAIEDAIRQTQEEETNT